MKALRAKVICALSCGKLGGTIHDSKVHSVVESRPSILNYSSSVYGLAECTRSYMAVLLTGAVKEMYRHESHSLL